MAKEKEAVAKWKKVFSIDYRSLAFFRISLGFLILFDLYVRSKELAAHYTDFGVLPRGIFLEKFSNKFWISIHLANGSIFFQGFLFIIAAIFAIALILGYKTRIATIFSWFLLISLQSRDPLVLQGGDILFRMLLFWAIFLPLGEKYSFDEVLKEKKGQEAKNGSALSFGTFGIMLQFAFVFIFSALLKTGAEWFPDGTAIYYALSIDQFATWLGKFLLGFPNLIHYFTYFVFFLELFGPVLFFVPLFFKQIRTFAIFLFLMLFIGMGTNLNLGPFPWICSTALIVFIPPWLWDKLGNFLQRKESKRLIVYYDGNCGSCRSSITFIRVFLLLPKQIFIPAQSNKETLHLMNYKNSWVVEFNEKRYFYFNAFKPVLSASPIFWPLSFLVSVSWINNFGNKCYKFFAQRKRHACEIRNEKKELSFKTKKSTAIVGNAIALFFIIYIFLWNVQSLGEKDALPDKLEFIGPLLRIDQYWNMFAPYPLKDDGWYVVEGKLSRGESVDLLRNGRSISFAKPENVAAMYPHERWRKYLMNLWNRDNEEHRELYLSYLCRKWNQERDIKKEKLEEIKMYFMLEITLPDYKKSEVDKELIADWTCGNKN